MTQSQLNRLKKAHEAGKDVTIKMSKSQVAYNMKVQGFLPLLAGLASQALPFLTCTVLPALGEAVPKSSRGWKWKNLLRRIWKDKSQYEGQGDYSAHKSSIISR